MTSNALQLYKFDMKCLFKGNRKNSNEQFIRLRIYWKFLPRTTKTRILKLTRIYIALPTTTNETDEPQANPNQFQWKLRKKKLYSIAVLFIAPIKLFFLRYSSKTCEIQQVFVAVFELSDTCIEIRKNGVELW